MTFNTVLQGDCLEVLKTLPSESIDCCVTSPPYYGLRDYGVDGQIGLEETPEEYIDNLVAAFREVKRVLKNEGTLWVNIGDSYAGTGDGRTGKDTLSSHNGGQMENANGGGKGFTKKATKECKKKDLIGIPWMLAFALRADGWYLRQDIIWQKPNPMPESVKDRCTKSHEYIFLLSKQPKYYFDHEAIQEEAVSSGMTDAQAAKIRFGGKKYGDNDDPHFATKSGNGWQPKHKNLQYDGQQNHSMHERRAEGLPDEQYVMRNKRDVWSVATQAVKEAHFATFPEKLIEPCILAGCPIGGVVLDPFFGSGTTGRVATRLNRQYLGIELNPDYIEIANKRTDNIQMSLIGMV